MHLKKLSNIASHNNWCTNFETQHTTKQMLEPRAQTRYLIGYDKYLPNMATKRSKNHSI